MVAVSLVPNMHEYHRLGRRPEQRLHLHRCPVWQLEPRPLLGDFVEPNILRLEPEHVLRPIGLHPVVRHARSLGLPRARGLRPESGTRIEILGPASVLSRDVEAWMVL